MQAGAYPYPWAKEAWAAWVAQAERAADLLPPIAERAAEAEPVVEEWRALAYVNPASPTAPYANAIANAHPAFASTVYAAISHAWAHAKPATSKTTLAHASP